MPGFVIRQRRLQTQSTRFARAQTRVVIAIHIRGPTQVAMSQERAEIVVCPGEVVPNGVRFIDLVSRGVIPIRGVKTGRRTTPENIALEVIPVASRFAFAVGFCESSSCLVVTIGIYDDIGWIDS